MCKLEKTMEEEVEFVSRALSTASFLMVRPVVLLGEATRTQAWNTSTLCVIDTTFAYTFQCML